MKMHLKNKKKLHFKKKITLIVILIALFLYVFINLSKNVSYYYLSYSEKEARKIIDLAVGNALTDEVLSKIKDKDLYDISKNDKNEIEMVDYDTFLVNNFLKDITDNIALALELEENDSDKIAFYIPFGSIFQNPILNNKGPKIPVRMEIIGSVLTNIKTKVTEYGINNCLIEMVVHVEVKEKVILPVIAKNITVTNDLPVSYKIIKGTVPSYYGSNINKDSSIYSVSVKSFGENYKRKLN